MAADVFVHIGPPKTGTTYLQDVMWRNREVLRDQGILVPGRSPVSQFHAAVEVVGRNSSRLDRHRTTMAWDRLLREIERFDGTAAVVSHENFGQAGPAAVRRVLADLEPARVHIVSTARAPVHVAPAAWQERVKNRSEQSWPEFMSELGGPGPFWRQHGGAALATWAGSVDPAQVHVVTVPPEGSAPGLLWRRFAGLIGADPDSCEHRVRRRNTSIGVEGVALLRRLNTELREVGWPTYRVAVKHSLARVLADQPGQPVTLSASDARMLDARAHEYVTTIRANGWHVVGDLGDLVVGAPAPDLVDNDATTEQLHDVTHSGLVGLLHVVTGLHRERQQVADHFELELERTQAELERTRDELHRVRTELELSRRLGASLPRLLARLRGGLQARLRGGLGRRPRRQRRRTWPVSLPDRRS